jgi:hypothetical protein
MSPRSSPCWTAAGRLQLPQDYLQALGLRDRVRLALEPDRIEVRPDRPHHVAETGDDA